MLLDAIHMQLANRYIGAELYYEIAQNTFLNPTALGAQAIIDYFWPSDDASNFEYQTDKFNRTLERIWNLVPDV